MGGGVERDMRVDLVNWPEEELWVRGEERGDLL